MQVVLGACGLICSKCDAYVATHSGDNDKLEAVAAHWRKIYQNPDITAESVRCQGCMNEEGVKCCHCRSGCEIHKCATEYKVPICGLCQEFPCPQMHEFMAYLGPKAQLHLNLHQAVACVAKQMESIAKN